MVTRALIILDLHDMLSVLDSVRIMNNELGFIFLCFYFIFGFLIFNLDKRCDVMTYVTVT